MEKMGYTDGNGDGYYDKKDGSGPLTLNFLSYWDTLAVRSVGRKRLGQAWHQGDNQGRGSPLELHQRQSRRPSTSTFFVIA